jgi:hypothetical protein
VSGPLKPFRSIALSRTKRIKCAFRACPNAGNVNIPRFCASRRRPFRRLHRARQPNFDLCPAGLDPANMHARGSAEISDFRQKALPLLACRERVSRRLWPVHGSSPVNVAGDPCAKREQCLSPGSARSTRYWKPGKERRGLAFGRVKNAGIDRTATSSQCDSPELRKTVPGRRLLASERACPQRRPPRNREQRLSRFCAIARCSNPRRVKNAGIDKR